MVSENDAVDISDLLIGYDPLQDAIDDFVTLAVNGSDTTMAVDRDGTSGTHSAQNIALFEGVTGLDADNMLTNGELIVV